MIEFKLNPCPKCKGKKITIVSTPMQLDPEKSMHQATCAKKACGWRAAWSSTAESAVSSWNWFNDRKPTKK